MTETEKQEFLQTASFRLIVDGQTIELNKVLWYGSGEKWILFYVEFDPDTFSPGKHEFSGIWHLEWNGKSYDYYSNKGKPWKIQVVEPP